MRTLVAMLGARMHYAVPRILHRAGALEQFFTDLSGSNGWPRLLGFIPRPFRTAGINRILSRVPEGVPPDHVTAFNGFGYLYARRRARASGLSKMTQTLLWANERFGELVCGSDWGKATAVFTFNCAGLEILQKAKRKGLGTVMEQTIVPSSLERRLVREERDFHPGWEDSPPDGFLAEYSRREQAEWPRADLILCGSDFVREGIRQCGGPVEKCIVVPYGVDIPSPSWGEDGRRPDEVPSLNHQPSTLNRPLRVLTVGAVGLRKGAPYVLEAAKKLKGKAQFRWVGALNLLPRMPASAASSV